jgi:general stress protein 26
LYLEREEAGMAQHEAAAGFKKVAELIEGIDIAMLTTVEQDGSLRSRPMATQELEFDGDLWFFTDAGSAKVYEVQQEHHVNASYSRPDKQRYVSLSGTAELVRDRAKMEQLWRPLLKAWFPDGLETPGIALLRVRVQRGEYWDAPHGAVAQLAGLASALVKGERADDVGEYAKIQIERGGGSSGTW